MDPTQVQPPNSQIQVQQMQIPRGLEALIPLNQIFVKQQIDILETVIGFVQPNRYCLFAPTGQMLYLADEDSDCCTRQYCGNKRGYTINVNDPTGQGIRLEKSLHCILADLTVFSSSTGEILGSVQQQCVCCSGPRFRLLDGAGNLVFIIKGPFCTTAICGSDVLFEVVSPQDESLVIGMITKAWGGLGLEYFTNADNFGISFPVDLSVKIKAVLIGACILIDFCFYEQATGQQTNY